MEITAFQESSIIHPSHLWKSEGNYWSIQESTFSWLNSQNKNKLTNISFFYLLNCMPTYLAKRYGNYRIQESSTRSGNMCIVHSLCHFSCKFNQENVLSCMYQKFPQLFHKWDGWIFFILRKYVRTYSHTYSYVPNDRAIVFLGNSDFFLSFV